LVDSGDSTAWATPPSNLGAPPQEIAKYTPAAKLRIERPTAAPIVVVRLGYLIWTIAAVTKGTREKVGSLRSH
jgi:hypothetical protein